MRYYRKSLQFLIETLQRSSTHFGGKQELFYGNLTLWSNSHIHFGMGLYFLHSYFLVPKALLGDDPKEKRKERLITLIHELSCLFPTLWGTHELSQEYTIPLTGFFSYIFLWNHEKLLSLNLFQGFHRGWKVSSGLLQALADCHLVLEKAVSTQDAL